MIGPEELGKFLHSIAETVAVLKQSACPDEKLAICIVVAVLDEDNKAQLVRSLANVQDSSLRALLEVVAKEATDAEMFTVKNTHDD